MTSDPEPVETSDEHHIQHLNTLNPEDTETSDAHHKQQAFLSTLNPEDAESVEIYRWDFRSKPYNAIMGILLKTWPLERKQRVFEDLKLLKSSISSLTEDIKALLSPYTLLLWNELNVAPYYQYINRHKSYVTLSFTYFNEIVLHRVKPRLLMEGLLPIAHDEEYLPNDDPTAEQIEVHDNSKYSFVETVTYAMKWYPCQELGECDEEAWGHGLRHHYCHNEHHPEFWGTKPMHWRYLVEAIYDMAAMELERKFQGHEPDNKAELLVFVPRFLKRFETTGQLELIQKVISYTIDAYCKQSGHQIPSMPS